VNDESAVAVEDAAQEEEGLADVEVGDIDVPVLMRPQGLLEARPLAGVRTGDIGNTRSGTWVTVSRFISATARKWATASGRRLAAVKRSELAARNRFGDPSCRLQLPIQDSQSNDIHMLFE